MKDKSGNSHTFRTAFTDLTVLKMTKKALKHEKDKLINILESMEDGVWITNRQYIIEYANPVIKKEFGATEGHKCYEYFHSKGICPWCKNQEVFLNKTVRWELYIPTLQKTYDIIEIPLKKLEGNIEKLVIFRDITVLKKAEEILRRDKETFKRLVIEKTDELVRAQKKLEMANRLFDINSLAAILAQKLRNPLAVIQTASYNIRRKTRNPSLDKHFDNIEKNISKSAQFISNLLFYSHIKIPNYKNISIYEILDECIGITKERLNTEKVFIYKNLKSLEDLCIEADPLQIREMFINILNNAYDAIKLMDNKGKIEIESEYDGKGFIKLCFKDSGAGISKKDLKRVCEPFFSTKSNVTGLGLTICSQIINLHAGKLEVESEKGKGTTVILSLPVKRKKQWQQKFL